MASKKRLDQAAGASIGGFFTKAEERQPEKEENQKEEPAKKDAQTAQEPHRVTEKAQPTISTHRAEKGEETANTKQKKQVFSFRASLNDISIWKAYSTASGQTMENIGTAAMNEYISNHALTGAERAVFDAMKARNKM